MVRDKNVHMEVIEKVVSFALDIGFSVKGLTYSPVKGPEGNIEYLIYLEKNEEIKESEVLDIAEIVEMSHTQL